MISIITDGDHTELDSLRMDLFGELSILPVSSIETVSTGEAPANTRGFDVIGLGQLVVKAGPDMTKKVVDTIRAWLDRTTARSVELTLNGDKVTLTRS